MTCDIRCCSLVERQIGADPCKIGIHRNTVVVAVGSWHTLTAIKPISVEDSAMTDLYTKVVLTIIAACMLWNIVAGGSKSSMALAQLAQKPSSDAIHVIVDAWGQHPAAYPIPVKPQQY